MELVPGFESPAAYRREMLGRRGIREEYVAAARRSLQAKGLLDGRGAVTNAGKNLLGREQWDYGYRG